MVKNISLFLFLFASHIALTQPSARTLRDIDSFIEKVRVEWNVPGIAVSIVQNGEIVFAKGFGLADLENQRAVDENTLFAIGSSSKAFTALSVLQLAEDGLVELDNPVLDYLPDFRMSDDYITNHLTVRDLLSHRSGLPRHDMVWYGALDSREELFNKLQYLEPSAGFREIFQYQNLMFMTAGYLVGQTQHSTWENEVQRRIFDPLEMNRSNFSVDDLQADGNHSFAYSLEDETPVKIDYRNIDAVGPAGSINSSVTEMAHWVTMQLNGGTYNDNTIISNSLLAQSHMSVIPVPGAWSAALATDLNYGPTTYGLGWFIGTHKGRRTLYHGGNIDGFSAMVGMLPSDSIGVVVLTNLNGNPLPAIIRNYIFDKLLDEEPRDWNAEMHKMVDNSKKQREMQRDEEDLKRIADTHPSHELDAYAGEYVHPAYGKLIVAPDGDSLHITYHAFEFNCGHYHYDVFVGENNLTGTMKVAFHTDMDGDIYELTTSLESQTDPIRFERKPTTKEFSDEELAAFTGDYLIQGVQKVTINQENGNLTLSVPGQPIYTLEYNKGLEFNLKGLDGFSTLFQKDADGNVTTLVMIQPNGQFRGERIKSESSD